jgi:hypothetical protein
METRAVQKLPKNDFTPNPLQCRSQSKMFQRTPMQTCAAPGFGASNTLQSLTLLAHFPQSRSSPSSTAMQHRTKRDTAIASSCNLERQSTSTPQDPHPAAAARSVVATSLSHHHGKETAVQRKRTEREREEQEENQKARGKKCVLPGNLEEPPKSAGKKCVLHNGTCCNNPAWFVWKPLINSFLLVPLVFCDKLRKPTTNQLWLLLSFPNKGGIGQVHLALL